MQITYKTKDVLYFYYIYLCGYRPNNLCIFVIYLQSFETKIMLLKMNIKNINRIEEVKYPTFTL